ncbi:nuclear transport factor 2 family protein [Streptomyces sp. NPDC058739]|uniref:nuclear transport factor 2 family protein n=1 Tax=Streptomyces sp. NPDC058739 TaxID=3346618 RepID=UPI0036B4EA39
MSANTTRYQDVVTRYLEAWNTTEAVALAKAVADVWSADGTYTDPASDVRGHDQITAMIAGTQDQFPGFVFRLVGEADGHHDTARFSWELVHESEGSAPVAGSDVITLDAEDRITAVYGFFDRIPDAV